MEILTLLEQARDTVNVRRVYAEPIERDGTTVIPAAAVQGGGGGGEGGGQDGEGGPEGHGAGGGWGARARPVGAYVIRGNEVTWQPAIDVSRIVLGGQVVAVVALLTLRTWLRRRR
ncbi:MAG TPA: spore germination protein GerW family protein [Acidimicrobiia bacterium]|jgi:uncharacterized spore protein YtfJ|nr:spore germination protein GerW family protein [Acidimicrobiia bacterium]